MHSLSSKLQSLVQILHTAKEIESCQSLIFSTIVPLETHITICKILRNNWHGLRRKVTHLKQLSTAKDLIKNDNYRTCQVLCMKSCAIWITGLPASGKTTIAALLKEYLDKTKTPSIILDGYEIRQTVSKDLKHLKKQHRKSA